LSDFPGNLKWHKPARLKRKCPKVADQKKRGYSKIKHESHEFKASLSPELQPGIAKRLYVKNSSS
jgi:hypothetical protein